VDRIDAPSIVWWITVAFDRVHAPSMNFAPISGQWQVGHAKTAQTTRGDVAVTNSTGLGALA
jgi:hypothetical protein